MASKENKFAATGGGAMLNNKPTAQSSFGMQNMGRNNAQMRPPQSMQAANGAAPNGGGENGENGQNPSELGNGNELQNAQNQGSPTDQVQKEALKKAGEAALSAAGVPQAASKKIIDKAEKEGLLDKINDEINKFKKKAIMKILPGLVPVLGGVVMVATVIIIISSIVGEIVETAEKIVQFFANAWDVATDYASGVKKEEKFFLAHFPKENYVDKRIEMLQNADPSIDRNYIKKEEIEKLANIWASIAAPIYYRMEELETDKWNNSDFLAYSVHDVCALSYSSLSDSNGVTYYQYVINNNQDVNSIKEAIPKIGCTELSDWEKFWNGFLNWNPLTAGAQDLITSISGALSSDSLASTLASKTGDYEYDSNAYEKYLKDYYLNKRYETYLKEYKEENVGATNEDALDYYASQISLYQSVYYSEFLDRLNKHFYPTGSASEEDLVATLSPVYGNNSCAALELYNPLTHEFTESQGVSSSDIHSVSDGEVIYVNKNTSNLYDKWDSSKQKCICDGSVCDNYDGNQIKVKFVVNDIEYIATYSNLDTVNVNVGDTVTKGQVIATEGNSGCTNMKKLKFQLTSENGINYNTNELLEKCSSSSNTMNACNFNNIQINLVDCDNKLIKNLPLYDYIKEDLYRNYKSGLDNVDFLKAGAISITSKFLNNNNYKVGVNELTVQACNYKEVEISSTDSRRLDEAINAIRGQVMTYNNKAALTRYELSCNRTEKDKTTNSVYNTMCINKALELARNGKNYQEILEIYYPNYRLNTNYCLNYASSINKYALNNDKSYISAFDEEEVEEINTDLKERINMVGTGTRAAAVETARYIALGLEGKIPYKNGGKYFEIGINPNWASNGFDSCGFISWVLFNSGADIEKSLTISGIVKSANITGNIKINSELYKYYDKIQVGDFAYREDRIGIVIGKNDGILYIAEANSEKGLIVTTISSYGESESAYTHIYFADNYYNGTGNITSMW